MPFIFSQIIYYTVFRIIGEEWAVAGYSRQDQSGFVQKRIPAFPPIALRRLSSNILSGSILLPRVTPPVVLNSYTTTTA
jgi:hypothetical protein